MTVREDVIVSGNRCDRFGDDRAAVAAALAGDAVLGCGRLSVALTVAGAVASRRPTRADTLAGVGSFLGTTTDDPGVPA